MTPEEEPKPISVDKYAIIILAIAVISCTGVLVTYFSIFNGPLSTSTSKWGEFGDFFGGTLNPIFGALSLMAILGTLLIQSRELSHSTRALKDQSNHLDLQAFENTFFSLIRLNADTVKNLTLEDSENNETHTGRGAFKILCQRLSLTYERIKKYESHGMDEKEIVLQTSQEFSNKNGRFCINYLNGIERILDFINNRCPQKTSKETYLKILISQLSNYELFILLYYSVSAENQLNNEKLKKINFFENLSTEALLDKALHSPFARDKKNDF
ncbi:putative phage abortive infection protein [Pseudomonas guguanensis]|uniref:putative phage abortive infection protein n=1 Tax=Ectopseudomonas guguanensis TaxID=1198456 RepID=UPI003263AF35